MASDDGRIKCISTLTTDEMAEMEGHEDAVQVVLFNSDGKTLISGSSDRTFRVWGQ